jgi:hypothetical protein
VYNFHVPLALKVGCLSSGVGCDTALVSIFLCVGLMAIFCGVAFFSGFISIGVYFVVSYLWCGVSRLLVEFLCVQLSQLLQLPDRSIEQCHSSYSFIVADLMK